MTHGSPKKKPTRIPRVRQDSELDEEEQVVNDRDAEEYYAQRLLNSVREGADPNDSEEEQEQEGYSVPHFDRADAQKRCKEHRATLKSLHKERVSRLKALRADKEHMKLSPFERITTEAEMWTGQRSAVGAGSPKKKPASATAGGISHRGSNSQLFEELEDEEDAAHSQLTSGERLTATPHYLKGTLRNYQMEGVSWLLSLADRGVNGILADEMGLGKTFQTISLLSYLKHTRGLPGPHLVVAPKSVLGNWAREFAKWCPSLHVYKFHGSSEIRPLLVRAHLKPVNDLKYDVVVTTFEMIISELSHFKKINWRYLIIDEAHKLKNNETVAHKALASLSTDHRLLVTGTPLQNDLKELWALLHFLIPELFDESEHFVKWFDSNTGEQDKEAVSRMHVMMAPLMLRRLKVEAATELPPKNEVYVGCKLSKKQRDWYVSVLAKDSDAINRASGQSGGGGAVEKLNNITMQLRKVCNHPYLFPGAEEGPPFKTDERLVKDSGKMMVLDKLLARLRKDPEDNHKVLIFSQMTRMLDILEDYLTFRGYKYFRIDGNSTGLDRDTQMAQFNNPKSDYFIFLLSTRSGGLGINLQAANHVVLYDSDWNPQADLQAQDRAHRIGQKRPVRVYRFITDKSFEERIYRRALKKLYLDAMVVEQGRLAKQHTHASKDELLSMIKFGADDIFKSSGSSEEVTDAEIEALLKAGEEKIKGMQREVANEQKANLATFELGVDESNVYEFEGINFGQGGATKTLHVTLPSMMTEDEVHKECGQYGEVVRACCHPNGKVALVTFRTQAGATDAMTHMTWPAAYCSKEGQHIVSAEMIDEGFELGENALPRRGGHGSVEKVSEKQLTDLTSAPQKFPLRVPKKPPTYPPHQFFNQKRINELHEIETGLIVEKWKKQCRRATLEFQGAREIPADLIIAPGDYELTADELAERERLLSEGFSNWTHREFLHFKKAVSSLGPHNIPAVVAKMQTFGTEKGEGEVRDYCAVFLEKGEEYLPKHFKAIKDIQAKQAARVKAAQETKEAVRWKMAQYENPEEELRLPKWRDERLREERFMFFYAVDHHMKAGGVHHRMLNKAAHQQDIFIMTRDKAWYQSKFANGIKLIQQERQDLESGGRKRTRARTEQEEFEAEMDAQGEGVSPANDGDGGTPASQSPQSRSPRAAAAGNETSEEAAGGPPSP